MVLLNFLLAIIVDAFSEVGGLGYAVAAAGHAVTHMVGGVRSVTKSPQVFITQCESRRAP